VIEINGKRFKWNIVQAGDRVMLRVDSLLVSDCDNMQQAIQDIVDIELEDVGVDPDDVIPV
jgi:hypothetical protein